MPFIPDFNLFTFRKYTFDDDMQHANMTFKFISMSLWGNHFKHSKASNLLTTEPISIDSPDLICASQLPARAVGQRLSVVKNTIYSSFQSSNQFSLCMSMAMGDKLNVVGHSIKNWVTFSTLLQWYFWAGFNYRLFLHWQLKNMNLDLFDVRTHTE